MPRISSLSCLLRAHKSSNSATALSYVILNP